MTVSFPGSDVLFSQSFAAAPPAATPPTGSASSGNPYRQTFDSLQTWSNQYLLQSLEYGAPAIPQFTAGGTASSFAQLSNLLAQIQPGIASGLYGGGTGFNALA